MSASEIIFLVSGLLLGVLAGAALVEVLRARPPVPREVRLTVATDAVPRRRGSTLSHDVFSAAAAEPARLGPADRRELDGTPPDGEADRRTGVRSAAPTDPAPVDPAPPDPAPIGPVPVEALPVAAAPVAIQVSGGIDPTLTAIRLAALPAAYREDGGSPAAETGDREPVFAQLVAARAVATPAERAGEPSDAPVARLESDRSSETTAAAAVGSAATAPANAPAATAPAAVSTGGAGPGGGAVPVGGTPGGPILGASDEPDPTDSCAAERRIAAERCGLAVRARSGATTAADAVRAAQRTYDEHVAAADTAAAVADPRAIRRDKENAQAQFRASYNGSHSAEDAEGAARAWLIRINDINAAARTATATAKRERAAATTISASLERLALEADAARIAAETAEAACLTARQALADCDERSVAGAAAPTPAAPWTEPPGPIADEDEPLAAALHEGGTPTIFRLVRGERPALVGLVDRLAGEDPVARRRWQSMLSGLVDAIVAVSIEAGTLTFPTEHPFWGAFTLTQDRDIGQALASLGHRFDGLGGFVDDRFPTQRDLSLALGYAGLDPMRVRVWPTEAEMAALYQEVSVAADEQLAGAAGDLTLSELIAMLGRRADGLAELWNEWGRVRPLLLEGA